MNRLTTYAITALVIISAVFVSGCFKTVPENVELTPQEQVVSEDHSAKLAEAHLELNKALRIYWNSVAAGYLPRSESVESDLKKAYISLENADQLLADGDDIFEIKSETASGLLLAHKVLQLLGQ